MTVNRSATILISAASGFVLLATGATAGAAIAGPVDSAGVIYGCYTTKANAAGSHTLVLEDVGSTCPPNTTAIKWNQTGPQGPAGPAGPVGPVGAIGATGPVGPVGAIGATGPAGPAGPKGDTGATGLAGPIGATGPAGPVGATGPAGPAGADGNTVLNGTGAPAVTVGNNGDFYLDVAADVLYGPKVRGTWPANGVSLAGNPGATGPAGPQGVPGPQGPAGPVGAAGPAGPAGADGNTVLNGTGAPAVTVGHDGDFYIDTAGDVLYGPKSGGTWPANGVSLVGSPGSPGTGATVAPLVPGDANCPNGGASVKDGGGNTAYACNGATGPAGPAGPPGSADLQSFQVIGNGFFTLQTGTGYTPVGLSKQITTDATSVYVVTANIVIDQVAPDQGGASCTLFADGSGALAVSTGYVYTNTPSTTIPVSARFVFAAGTHTIEVRCQGLTGLPVTVEDQSSAMIGFRAF
jgi:hypothetical protein